MIDDRNMKVFDDLFGELTAGAGVAYNTQDGGCLYFKPQLHYRIAFMF